MPLENKIKNGSDYFDWIMNNQKRRRISNKIERAHIKIGILFKFLFATVANQVIGHKLAVTLIYLLSFHSRESTFDSFFNLFPQLTVMIIWVISFHILMVQLFPVWLDQTQ